MPGKTASSKNKTAKNEKATNKDAKKREPGKKQAKKHEKKKLASAKPAAPAKPLQRKAKGLVVLEPRHPRMRALRRAGHVAEIHGNKLWDSSFLLMKMLERRGVKPGARILEIGCGWGLLGLWCNRSFGAEVHGIDADANVLPYVDLHAEVNGLKMTAEKKRFEQLTVDYLSSFDLVIGADICFWDDLSRALFNLVKRSRKAGVETVMIADPRRPPFTDLEERCAARLHGRGSQVDCIDVAIKRPVKASGQVLVVDHR